MKGYFAIAFLVVVGILSACSSDSISSSADIVFPDKNVSYNQHVYPFLKLSCAYSGCHDESAAGGVNMNNWVGLFATLQLVVPGKPDDSRLIQILDDKLPHMTRFYRGNIKANHIKGMRVWIAEGAKLN